MTIGGTGSAMRRFQTERVKGHSEMIYRMQSHQIGVQKSKSETVVLCELSLHADLRQSRSTLGGGFPQLTSQ